MKQAETFSIRQALLAASTDRGLGAFDSHTGAVCAAAAAENGGHHDPHRLTVPIRCLAGGPRRDLSAGTGTAGGYLVAQDMADPWAPLLTYSPVMDAGATRFTGLRGDAPVPVFSGGVVPAWLSSETTSTPETQPVIGQLMLRPKSVSVYTEVARQLLAQASPAAEAAIARYIQAETAKALDAAVFNGSGGSGQPRGILNTAGIGTASGTALSWSTVCTLEQSVVGSVGSDRQIAWIGGAGTRTTLAKRERAAGSGFIWDANRIGGAPAYASGGIATDGLMLGVWSALAVGLWGDSIQIEVNPFANFQAGIVAMRIILSADVAVMNPAYFSAVSSVT